jgi:hypothetical protein
MRRIERTRSRVFAYAGTTLITLSYCLPAMAKPRCDLSVVFGTTVPWTWGKHLNAAYPFGIQDGTVPSEVDLSDISAHKNHLISIQYVGGTISSGAGLPYVDANGDTGYATDGSIGPDGTVFPSLYMSPYPIYLTELVGAFVNNSAKIIGTPFAIGNGPTLVTVPSHAFALLLGVNDDQFNDNDGFWNVTVCKVK